MQLTFLASDIAKVTSSSTTAFWFVSCGWIKIVFATDLGIFMVIYIKYPLPVKLKSISGQLPAV